VSVGEQNRTTRSNWAAKKIASEGGKKPVGGGQIDGGTSELCCVRTSRVGGRREGRTTKGTGKRTKFLPGAGWGGPRKENTPVKRP